VIGEAPLDQTPEGLVPRGEGWFVVNARDARWLDDGPLGIYTPFAGETRFPQVGINLCVLQPGQPNCMYHREDEQEDFLVLSGECLLLVEEQERLLRAWDFVHLPAGTDHVLVGAGDGPCAALLIGSRTPGSGVVYPESDGPCAALLIGSRTPGSGVVYPESPLARRHNAGVETETDSPEQAYSSFATGTPIAYRDGTLP
jgi:uncharacterized cupin superfamily protein